MSSSSPPMISPAWKEIAHNLAIGIQISRAFPTTQHLDKKESCTLQGWKPSLLPSQSGALIPADSRPLRISLTRCCLVREHLSLNKKNGPAYKPRLTMSVQDCCNWTQLGSSNVILKGIHLVCLQYS